MKVIATYLIAIAALVLVTVGGAQAGLLQDNAKRDIDESAKLLVEGTLDTNQNIGTTMVSIIKGFLALLGIIFLVLIIYAGYSWMTAAGEEEKVTRAKDTIRRAIIGLLIIVSAYAITYFVFQNLPGSTGSGGGSPTGPVGGSP